MRGWGKIREREDRDGYMVDIRIDGRRIRESYPTKALASAALKRLQYVRATGGPAPGDPGPTYGDLAPQLLAEYEARGYSDRTLQTYRLLIGRVLRTWRERRISRTRQGDVLAWIRDLQRDGLASSTIRLLCDRLSQIHRLAERDELVPTTPCRVPRPTLVSQRRDPLPEDELLRLLEAAAAEPEPLAVLLLAADAGLRAAEIAGLELRDVDLERRWISVRLGKGRKSREVPIFTGRLANALRRLGQRPGRLFRGRDRERAAAIVGPLWRRVLKREPELHRLRHRFATVALGAPDAAADDVRRYLGHTSLDMTARYVHARAAAPPPGIGAALERSRAPDGHQGVADIPREEKAKSQ